MKATIRLLQVALLCSLAATGAGGDESPAAAPEAAGAAPNPLAPFVRLIGGEWHIGPYRHVYEWGVGERTVVARTYDDQGRLASEARWFYHPGEQVIRGYSVDPGGSLFEMTTSFDGDQLHNRLRTYGADGKVTDWSADWVFTGDDQYDWTLHVETEEGPKQTMQASATRKPAKPSD